MGLAIGFLFGLLVAGNVVRHIEGPLQDALEKFYREKTESELRAKYPQLDSQVIEFMQRKGFVFEEVYWETRELAADLRGPRRPIARHRPPHSTTSETASPPTAPVVRHQ